MAAVKHFRWDVGFLQQIAAHYLGQPVIVEMVDNAGWRGEASKRGGIARIRLGTEQDVTQFDYSYWHELAHLKLHKFITDAPGPTHDISEATKAAAAAPSNEVLEIVRLKIEREEAEADALAVQMRNDFEQRLGHPLSSLARIVR